MPTKKTTRTAKQTPPSTSRKLTPMPPLAPMIVRNVPAPRPAPTCDQIAHRAYELFVARGYQHGHDVEDWLQAENELWSNRSR